MDTKNTPDWLDLTTIYSPQEPTIVALSPCGAIQIRHGLDAKAPVAKWGWQVLYSRSPAENPHPFPAHCYLDSEAPETKRYQDWQDAQVSRVRQEVADVIRAHGKTPAQ